MLEALITAIISCAIVLLVAWLLTVLIGLIPAPPPIRSALPTLIWAAAAIICLIVLLRVLLGSPVLP